VRYFKIVVMFFVLTGWFILPVSAAEYQRSWVWGNGEYKDVLIYDGYAFCNTVSSGLDIIDINNIEEPSRVSIIGVQNIEHMLIMDHYLLLGGDFFPELFDISDPSNPKEMDIWSKYHEIMDESYGGAISGSLAYFACGNDGLKILDMSDPLNPQLVSHLDEYTYGKMVVQGDVLYALDTPHGLLRIFDVSDPENPSELSEYSFGNQDVLDMAVEDDFAVITAGGKYAIVLNVSDPTNPTSMRTPETPGNAIGVTIRDGIAYIGQESIPYQFDGGLTLVQLSVSNGPYVVGSFESTSLTGALEVEGENLFASAGHEGLQIFDLTSPKVPALKSSYKENGGVSFAKTMDYWDHYLIGACMDDGLVILDCNARQSKDRLVWKSGSDDNLSTVRDVKVQNGIAYVLSNSSQGSLVVFDVSNPSDPIELSRTQEGMGKAYYLEILGHYAYVRCYDEEKNLGIKVFDISDPANPTAGNFVLAPQMGSFPMYRPYVDSIFRFCVSEGKLLVAGGTYGILAYDLTDPANPVFCSNLPLKYSSTVYGDYSFVYDIVVKNNIAYVACDHDVGAVDVSDLYHMGSITHASSGLSLIRTLSLDGDYMGAGTGEFTYNEGFEMTVTDKGFGVSYGLYTLGHSVDVLQKGTKLFVCSGYGGEFTEYQFGKKLNIPHIATTWGWTTSLIFNNDGFSTELAHYNLYDANGDIIEQKDVEVNPRATKVIQLEQGTCGDVRALGYYTTAKVSYKHVEDLGITEFQLDGNTGTVNNFVMPKYLSDHMTWMGIAIENPNELAADVTVSAIGEDGAQLAEFEDTIQGREKMAGVLSALFPETDWHQIARVKVVSNRELCGIAISGNENKQLLFTKSVNQPLSETRILPHIADGFDFWENYLILDNLSSVDTQECNLTLYSGGADVMNEHISVLPGCNKIVDLNTYADLAPDSGVITSAASDLVARQSYVYRQTHGTAEFLLTGSSNKNISFNLPSYASDDLNWKGFAFWNTAEQQANVTLYAFSDGIKVGEKSLTLNGHCKYAALVDGLFEGNDSPLSCVVAVSDSPLSGLNISGANQDRYLFTQAVPSCAVDLILSDKK
jgi:hypothetical protein